MQAIRDRLKWRPSRGVQVAALAVIALVSSAVAVAYSAHKNRQYLIERQRYQAERHQLETEYGQLLLEQHAWGAYGRVGRVATEQLGMRHPEPQEIIMVRQ